jgi:hypothetical protein
MRQVIKFYDEGRAATPPFVFLRSISNEGRRERGGKRIEFVLNSIGSWYSFFFAFYN